MRRLLIASAVSILVAAALDPVFGKATHFRWRVDRVEAIIMNAFISANWGDTDWNFDLRPLPLADATSRANQHFFRMFWDPDNRGYSWSIADYRWQDHLADWFGEARGRWSDACRRCAGSAGERCEIRDDAYYLTHPCPQIFSCEPCLSDLERITGESLSRFTPQAELFFGDGMNEYNANLRQAMWEMGIVNSCRESDSSPEPGSPCGRRVILSGVFTREQLHSFKPELHPLSTMIIEQGSGEYSVGAFIDGSVDSNIRQWGHWMTEYRSLGEDLYPSTKVINLAELQSPSPPSYFGGVSARRYCEITPRYSYHVLGVEPPMRDGETAYFDTCPTIRVRLDRSAEWGAAWVARVNTGWRRNDHLLNFRVVPTGGEGVLSRERPSGGRSARCEVPPGASAAAGYKRWYHWSVDVTGSFPGYAPPDYRLIWSWPRTPGSVTLVPDPPMSLMGGSSFSFGAWAPVSAAWGSPVDERYVGRLEVDVTAEHRGTGRRELVGGAGRDLAVPHPTVRLTASAPTVTAAGPGGAQFRTQVTATADGFCGAQSTWQYAWRRNGRPIADRGPGPVTVDLREGYSAEMEVTVSDAAGVEIATATRVLSAPRLVVDVEDSCAVEVVSQQAPVPVQGWAGGGPKIPRALCGRVRLVATPSDAGGMGILARGNRLEGVSIRWSDVKYASEATGWTWTPVPPAWLTTSRAGYDGDTLGIASGRPDYYRWHATVEVTDAWRRHAIANVAGSNDYSAPDVTVDAVRVIDRAQAPVRAPLPALRGTQAPDPGLEDRMAGLRALLRLPRKTPGTVAFLREEADAMAERAALAAARRQGLAVRAVDPPSFAVRAPERPWQKDIQLRAQRAAIGRVLRDIRLQPALKLREQPPAPKREGPDTEPPSR